MTYLKGMLSGIAAISFTLLVPGLLDGFIAIGQQKATGLGVVMGGLVEALLSPRFWIIAVLLFFLFFAASRLGSKALRVVLFWTPTVVFSTLGFAYVALITYLWIHFRKG